MSRQRLEHVRGGKRVWRGFRNTQPEAGRVHVVARSGHGVPYLSLCGRPGGSSRHRPGQPLRFPASQLGASCCQGRVFVSCIQRSSRRPRSPLRPGKPRRRAFRFGLAFVKNADLVYRAASSAVLGSISAAEFVKPDSTHIIHVTSEVRCGHSCLPVDATDVPMSASGKSET